MIIVTFLVPVADNDGRAFRSADFARFESLVVDLFGGVTKLPGHAAGQWRDGGRIYTDRSRVYQVALKSITEGEKIATLVSLAKSHFRQEAILIGYLGLAEIL